MYIFICPSLVCGYEVRLIYVYIRCVRVGCQVHLLHEDRGPVIEILVARTLRHVEASQTMCRIVGLSATLPNYLDVAQFLSVPPRGTFFFDGRYRPVPLTQYYVGVTEKNSMKRRTVMNEVCFEKVLESVKQGNQVMVFVHSRNDTLKTAQFLREAAASQGHEGLFSSYSSAGADRDTAAALEEDKKIWATTCF